MTDTPRDRLRELLDAVLDESNRVLQHMAGPNALAAGVGTDDGDPINWLRAPAL